MLRVVHERQRLPFGLEAGDHLFGVHAELDDLERDPAAHRLLLLGHIDHAATALADLLAELVMADLVAGLLGHGDHACGEGDGPAENCSGRVVQEFAGMVVGCEQGGNAAAALFVAGQGAFEIGCPRIRGRLEHGLSEDFFVREMVGVVHRLPGALVACRRGYAKTGFSAPRWRVGISRAGIGTEVSQVSGTRRRGRSPGRAGSAGMTMRWVQAGQ